MNDIISFRLATAVEFALRSYLADGGISFRRFFFSCPVNYSILLASRFTCSRVSVCKLVLCVATCSAIVNELQFKRFENNS